mmetsp:Transcript_51957/g.110418  ORF Transcript_51957/g.110418 Transcript_51957/m.110418 type:complete len:142 (+) Transcript_51957:163-588(+)
MAHRPGLSIWAPTSRKKPGPDSRQTEEKWNPSCSPNINFDMNLKTTATTSSTNINAFPATRSQGWSGQPCRPGEKRQEPSRHKKNTNKNKKKSQHSRSPIQFFQGRRQKCQWEQQGRQNYQGWRGRGLRPGRPFPMRTSQQ